MLLSKSSESFAYASAAIRYISSHDRHPDTSLNNLLVLSPDCAYEAYAELDLLYHHILESIDPRTRYIVLKILCLYCSRFMGYIHWIGILFGEKTSTLELALVKMSSVIQFEWQSGRFPIYHTSFGDFLRDKVCSGGLYVYSSDVATPVAAALMSRIWVPPVIFSQDDHLLTDITGMIEDFDAIAVDMKIHILRAFIASPFPITLAMYRMLVFRIFFAKIDRGSQSKDHPAALTQLFLGAFEHLAMWLEDIKALENKNAVGVQDIESAIQQNGVLQRELSK
ncbi:hypothetical protein D9619_008795 [Psilocybe cf. subviscida]|uniref:Uncharacterized protein n=1 Tax=Psilocybe cf. subviscida TaxID=2480587 RepID=A0A8H5BA33_9AGAR|nr:hypothetical protein D9619_008795 [Psilocybe cf. subviscida]